MIEEHIRLVRESRDRLRGAGVRVAPAFYERLFATAPEVRPLFKSGISGQSVKFEAMLDFIVDGLPEWSSSLTQIEALGRAHRDFGAVAAHYEVVVEALIYTLSNSLGDAFNPQVEAAWRDLLGMVSRVMIDASNYGKWSPEGDDASNPLAPIVGITIQRYAYLVFTLGDLEPAELTDDKLTPLGLDKQIWEAVRSGWNARLTNPQYGALVATQYMSAYRGCQNTA